VSGNWTGHGGDSYTCHYFCNRSGGQGGSGGGVYNALTLVITSSTASGNTTGNGSRDGDASAVPGNNEGDHSISIIGLPRHRYFLPIVRNNH
jgi:hypothetical protein